MAEVTQTDRGRSTPRPRPAAAARLLGNIAHRLWPFALVIAAWQAWITLGGIQVIVAPAPLDVARSIWSQPAVYAENTVWTVVYSVCGLALGMAVGSLIALLCWFSSLLRGLLTPATILLQSVPIVAVVPIMALLFGYEPRTVVGAASLLTFFPTFVFVSSGLRATPSGSDDLFRAMGASRGTQLRRLAVPSAVPNLLIALRLNASIAIIAAIIGEYLMGQIGLGKLFAQSFQMFDTPVAWGASVIIVALSVIAYSLSSGLERRSRPRWTL
jgi:ABC-type nitrate/sulfonate/bicarbonate transport system permease component